MTTQNSTQYANQIAIPPVIMEANQFYGKLRVMKFNFTQSGAGSAASIARLIRLPAGKVMLLALNSRVKTSAMGTGRTMHLGYAQYRLQDGTIQTASNAAINSAVDVAAAATTTPGAALADGTITFISRGGVILIATINVGTIPDTATIQGTWVFAVE